MSDAPRDFAARFGLQPGQIRSDADTVTNLRAMVAKLPQGEDATGGELLKHALEARLNRTYDPLSEAVIGVVEDFFERIARGEEPVETPTHDLRAIARERIVGPFIEWVKAEAADSGKPLGEACLNPDSLAGSIGTHLRGFADIARQVYQERQAALGGGGSLYR